MNKPQTKAKNVAKAISSAMGAHGLTGSTGIGVGGFLHVNAPYDSNGMVFVDWQYRRRLPKSIWYKDHRGRLVKEERCDSWKRMTRYRAKKEGRKPIECCMCGRPAVSLSHSYPYDVCDNLCAEHFKQKRRKYKEKN